MSVIDDYASPEVYESITLRKGEQNELARLFFDFVDGMGIFKVYRCRLCGTEVGAPSPRLAARYHSSKHPEIEQAFREAGLFNVWKEEAS